MRELRTGAAALILCVVWGRFAFGQAPQETPAAGSIAEVSIRTDGDCPSPLMLAESMREQGIHVNDASSRQVSLRTSEDGVQLELRADGESLDRSLRSDDCEAIAEVSAFIVRRHFEELNIPLDAIPVAEAVDPQDESPTPPDVSDVSDVSPPEEPIAEPAPSSPPPARFWLGVGGRLDVQLDPSGVGVGVDVWVGLELRSWLFRIALGAAPKRSAAEAPPVEVLPLAMRLDVGPRFTLAEWFALMPAFSVGIDLSRVEAPMEAGSPQVWRSVAVVGGGLSLQLRVARGFWLLLDALALVAPRVDRYRIEPLGEVGRSPRARLHVGLGLGGRIPGS